MARLWQPIVQLRKSGKNALPWDAGSMGDCSLTRLALRFAMDGRMVSFCVKKLRTGKEVYFLCDNYLSQRVYWRAIPTQGTLLHCSRQEKEEILAWICHFAQERNTDALWATDKRIMREWQKDLGKRFPCLTHENWFDYYYRSEDFARLVGRPLAKKRNFCRRFAKNCPNAQFTVFRQKPEKRQMQRIDHFLQRWYANFPRKTESLMREKAFLYRILASETDLVWGLGILENEGQIVGVTLGAFATEDTFVVHFEKALKDVDGAYPYLAHSFAKALCCSVYLNREEDLGLPGLRKAKHDWHPVRMGKKGLFCITKKEVR